MIFRQARPSETEKVFREGYRAWSRGRTYEQYCSDNMKEDAYGSRYVIEEDGEIVSSLILLDLKSFHGKAVCGIGSVIAHEGHGRKGYATELVKQSVAGAEKDCALIFLYSDIDPAFYERFGFKALPDYLQKKSGSVCMARCSDDIWNKLLAGSVSDIPGYF